MDFLFAILMQKKELTKNLEQDEKNDGNNHDSYLAKLIHFSG
jgi:hypothetical protein